MDQTDRFFQILPPETTGEHQVLSTATAAAAANYDWATALSTYVPKGSCFLLLEALTQDCYVRFKPTTATAATTTSNGLLIKAGQPGRPFWVNPTSHGVIDVIAGGAGTLKVQVASKIGNRNYQ